MIAGQDGPVRSLYWHFPAYLEAYRGSDDTWRTTPVSALRAGKWKLLHFFEDERTELYDLGVDPGETTDLASVWPDTATALLAELRSWWDATGAYIPVPVE
jgi:arylsulfatase A-like enzyme